MIAVSEELVVRPMAAKDVEWAKELAAGSAQAPRWANSAYDAAIDPNSSPRRIALVAEVARDSPHLGRIASRVAFAVASFVPPQAELETIVVAPAVRRAGAGAALMRAMLGELKTIGAKEVTLEVRVSNLPALALYRSLGFIERGRRSGYYADPVEDAVILRLELD